MKNIVLFIFLFSKCFAQNLVPNYSFEMVNGCPAFNNAPFGPDVIYQYAPPWRSYQNSIDLFDYCENIQNGLLHPFRNHKGHQVPFDGNRYCGFAYRAFADTSFLIVEYLGVELIQPMVIGQTYQVEIQVSLADTSDRASNNIGVLFLTRGYDTNNDPIFMPDRCHVCEDTIITDDEHWTSIHGTLTADSAYTHLVIGNLLRHTDYLYGVGYAQQVFCYYYVDHVCVTPVGGDCEVPVSVGQPQPGAGLSVFPNPLVKGRSGILHFSKESDVEAYDMMGQRVGLYVNVIEVDAGGWPAGVYLLKKGDGEVYKLIVIE